MLSLDAKGVDVKKSKLLFFLWLFVSVYTLDMFVFIAICFLFSW